MQAEVFYCTLIVGSTSHQARFGATAERACAAAGHDSSRGKRSEMGRRTFRRLSSYLAVGERSFFGCDSRLMLPN
jgi:hypothetical protein